MNVTETKLKGCFVIEPLVFNDERGYFFESFSQKKFEALIGEDINFVQDNQSGSSRGVLRGLHYQKAPFSQAKLVRVIAGSVLDICVDLRKESPTFGQYFSIVLDDKTNKQLFIPKGFAHGFLTLEDNTIFSYKCDAFYNKASEEGIIYNDKDLSIDWNFPEEDLIISEKDRGLLTFETVLKTK